LHIVSFFEAVLHDMFHTLHFFIFVLYLLFCYSNPGTYYNELTIATCTLFC